MKNCQPQSATEKHPSPWLSGICDAGKSKCCTLLSAVFNGVKVPTLVTSLPKHSAAWPRYYSWTVCYLVSLMFLLLLFCFVFNLRGRERQAGREPVGSQVTLQMTYMGCSSARGCEPGMQSRSPRGVQEPSFLSHPCCLPGWTLAGTWSQEPELRIEPG